MNHLRYLFVCLAVARYLGRDKGRETMKLIALDPSSSCTGYAVFANGKLIDAGRLRGKSAATALYRISAMRLDLLNELLAEHQPQTIVIEMPLEKQHTRTPGKKSGLPIWGMAAGALWATCLQYADETTDGPCSVYPVSNTLWTRGKSKDARQLAVKMEHKGYDPAKDRGADVSDAIALGQWWLAQDDRNRTMELVRLTTMEGR